MTILDGKAYAKLVRAGIAAQIAERTQAGKAIPGLTVVLVGDDLASATYVRNKEKAAAEVGIRGRVVRLPATTTQEELLRQLAELNADPAVHGILVQLPLPKGIAEESILGAIDPRKDVDGFHPENFGLLAAGRPRLLPCTPHGVIQLLAHYNIATAGREVVIVGRSNIVGKPLALMLLQKPSRVNPTGGDSTVTVAHTRTHDLAAVCRRADILVAAVGKEKIITPDMVKPGAVVVDVGINIGADGKLRGDVDPEVARVASAMTPVPGGVGPMTIAMLLANTLRAAEMMETTA